MSDIRDTQGADNAEGNAEFEAEFARLGGADQQDDPSPDAGDDDQDDGQAKDDAGQSGDASPKPDAPASQPGADATTDPWASAPEELRQLHQQEIEKLNQTIRSNSGRLSATTRELNALKQSLSSQRDEAAATKEGEEATNREERVKQLREEYPEIAAPILDMIADLEGKVRTLSAAENARTASATETVLDEQTELVEQAHPGMLAKLDSDAETQKAFVEWANRQPAYVVEAIKRNGTVVQDAAETIDILNRFAAETGAGNTQKQSFQDRRQRQLQAGRLDTGRSPSADPDSPGGDDYESEWKRLAALEARKAARR